ncbi:MAG: putative toxin-antitoxin system toxin component, PIN family [Saprospiraceae bacterium]
MVKINRIIIDTNLWISFLISNQYNQLDFLISSKKCTLIFSQDLLDEFLEVANRPKLRSYFSNADIESLLEIITEFSEFIEVNSKIVFLQDAKDDFLLSLAVDGEADYLITGDKELIEAGKFNKTEIISMSEFLKKFDSE